MVFGAFVAVTVVVRALPAVVGDGNILVVIVNAVALGGVGVDECVAVFVYAVVVIDAVANVISVGIAVFVAAVAVVVDGSWCLHCCNSCCSCSSCCC